jgi:hypothetical protein
MELEDLFVRLWPTAAHDTGMMILVIWRYVMILLVMLVLAMQPDGSTFYTIMLGLTVVAIVIDAAWAFSEIPVTKNSPAITLQMAWRDHNQQLAVPLLRAVTIVTPLFVAGGTKNKKSRGPAILTGILAAVYFFATWIAYNYTGAPTPAT